MQKKLNERNGDLQAFKMIESGCDFYYFLVSQAAFYVYQQVKA